MLLDEDERIIYAPSMLDEGKSLATSAAEDLHLYKDLLTRRDYHPAQFDAKRRTGHRVGRRKLASVQESTRDALADAINKFQRGKLDEDGLRKQMVGVMREAWRDVFLAGVRSGGHPGPGSGGSGPMVKLQEGDDLWLRGAMKHEMRFLNKFIGDIVEGRGRMPYLQRADMYIDTLKGFFESSRVIALPYNVVIHWVATEDKGTCAGCKFLAEHSPYTKLTIPGLPAQGLCSCLCLTGCNTPVLTQRGYIPIIDVQVDDMVWTHRNRWRRVLDVPRNASEQRHRYAVLVGDKGRLFGLTTDHLVWTDHGWVTAEKAATNNWRVLRCVPCAGGLLEPIGIVSPLRDVAYVAKPVGEKTAQAFDVRALWENKKWSAQKSDWIVSGLRDDFALEGEAWFSQAHGVDRVWAVGSAAIRGFERSVIHTLQEGWQTLCALLGRGCEAVYLPVSLALAEEARFNSTGICTASQKRESFRRPLMQFGIEDQSEARVGSWDETSAQNCMYVLWALICRYATARSPASLLLQELFSPSGYAANRLCVPMVRPEVYAQTVRAAQGGSVWGGNKVLFTEMYGAVSSRPNACH